jgi:hypothetical protein
MEAGILKSCFIQLLITVIQADNKVLINSQRKNFRSRKYRKPKRKLDTLIT